MKKVGIIANIAKEKSSEYTAALRQWMIGRGLEVYLEEGIAAKIGGLPGVERRELWSIVDLIVVFGGDGTILRTARLVRDRDVPIVGINLGVFGYLTEVNLDEMYSALEVILAGEFQVEKRMMLDVEINGGEETLLEGSVLNDVVINRGNLSRIIELETTVDDRYMTTFKADGLIISTPTGSTAYSLSAGGPIVFPELYSIIINPICPHTLTNRPIILPESAEIKVTLRTMEKGANVTLDGQVSYTVKSGDTVTIRKSRHVITLVSSPHRGYLEILRTKLGWGGSQTGAAWERQDAHGTEYP
ncbi:MAG: NAD(+) kinase [Deltaproteobacteria bacterium RBG_16_58_17]|nr:MAG: NAD(+) kinase [Deltaproteobacteria bacterium RBG_16_58_17]OHE18126.1 MAG: NAD(+) kinase [Syntrophobacterales bacterium GWC2_56_13]OHE21021.1 MAG: NAD(+) kinase [Syntrophobacterales bacterium GWF2_56_9]